MKVNVLKHVNKHEKFMTNNWLKLKNNVKMLDEKWRTGKFDLLSSIDKKKYIFICSKNIQLFTFSSTDSDSSTRSSPNLIAGGREMKMNYGHTKHFLLHQRSLPTEFKRINSPSENAQIKQMKNVRVLFNRDSRFIDTMFSILDNRRTIESDSTR